ncbi:MAG: tetratricopeptide repeat protein [Desulfococcaceae bacterium]
MDVKKEIKSLLNQSEIYKSQGLLRDARDKYIRAGQLIQKNAGSIGNHKSLLSAISKKLQMVKEEIRKLEDLPEQKEMSEQVQEIIRTKFAYSQDEKRAEIDGAIALAKFGQYARALDEFRKLLAKDEFRVEAAKNILRCHITLDAPGDAVRQYQNWFSENFFPGEAMGQIYHLLRDVLEKKGFEAVLSKPEEKEPAGAEDNKIIPEPVPGISENEILDISSVGITIPDGQDRSKTFEYDVSFQSGSIINLLVSDRDKSFLNAIESGTVLKAQFYSPMAMFEGKAVVVSVSRIESGPKTGHYSVDIKIQSI